ncbi:MAG: cytochrome c biogenesis protein CcdA [Bacteroidota bacterium]
MQRLLLFFGLIVLSGTLSAQILTPVSWNFSVESLENDEALLIATASLDAGWTIYSQELDDGGPVPTSFFWEEGEHYDLLGSTSEEGHRKSGEDEFFMMEVIKYLSDQPVVFKQRIKVLDYSQPITGFVEYMSCDHEQCLPPTEEPFSFQVVPAGPARGAVEEVAAPEISITEAPAAETAPAATAPAEVQNIDLTTAEEKEEAPAETANTELTETSDWAANLSIPGPSPTIQDPLTWDLEVMDLGNQEYDIRLIGHLLDGWYTYSSQLELGPDEIGPLPTELVVTTAEGYELLGEMTETTPNRKTAFDEIWGMDIPKITGPEPVVLQQRIRLTEADQVDFLLDYQVCEEGKCIPGGFEFSLQANPLQLMLDGQMANLATAPVNEDPENASVIDPEPKAQCNTGALNAQGLGMWKTFGYGLLGGLFALIMPCIFPMIPLTVNFFNKSSGSRAAGIRRAALYGFFIFLVYILLSIPFHLVEGVSAGILNTIASNVWVNLAFFAVFIVFAGSFFGFYELTLPEKWSNRSSQAEGTGGVIGIFFMALTLALVSFSCTGPILGSLLAGTASEGAWPLTAGMAGFGLAIGLPFALFAAFPQVLRSLPQSGGWLNSVKVVLGFVEVALAFKFLSNADLVGEWGLLKLEPFYLIWIVCCLGIVAYLMGWINFPHDTKGRRLKGLGAATAIASLLFAVYLGTGFRTNEDLGSYQPLGMLSGLAPPVCYNFFQPCENGDCDKIFKDLGEGLAYAEEHNMPVMLDFTGYTCVNCRKMEENVWTEPQIRDLLCNDFVLISLYVDDRSELPEEQQERVARLDGREGTILLDRVGEKWHYLQQQAYNYNAQPYYALVTPNGETLNPPVAYTPDVDEYEAFLRCGLSAFEDLSVSR